MEAIKQPSNYHTQLTSFFLHLLSEAKPDQRRNALKFMRLVNEVTPVDEHSLFKTLYQDALEAYPEIYFWQLLEGDEFISKIELNEYWLKRLSKSNNKSVLYAVITHPECPIDILRYFSTQDWSLRVKVARQAKLPSEILEKLAQDSDDRVREAVAENNSSTIKLLEKLAQDKVDIVRVAVAQNYKSTSAILEQLANDSNVHIRELVANNPNTSFYSLESFTRDKRKVVRRAVASRDLPEYILNILAKDILPEIKNVIACKENLPALTLDILSSDTDSYIRFLVAGNKSCTPTIVNRLSADDSVGVKSALAKNPTISNDVFIKLSLELSENIDWRYRLSVANNTRTASEILVKLSFDVNDHVLIAVAMHLNTPIATLNKLAQNKSAAVRSAIVNNQLTQIETLEALQSDSEPVYIRNKILNEELTQLLSSLLAPETNDIIFFVDEVHSLSLEDKSILIQQLFDFEKRDSIGLLSNYIISKELMNALLTIVINRNNPCEQIDLAENPLTPPEILEKLGLESSWSSVQGCLARNVSTPKNILIGLADGSLAGICVLDLDNPSISNDILSYLAETDSYKARYTISKYQSTPGSILQKLADDEYIDIRLNVARHPNTDKGIKYKILFDLADHKLKETRDSITKILIADVIKSQQVNGFLKIDLSDEDKAIFRMLLSKEAEYMTIKSSSPLSRLIALLSPLTSVKILQKYSVSDCYNERISVAFHPSTTKKILEQLIKDDNVLVKDAVKCFV